MPCVFFIPTHNKQIVQLFHFQIFQQFYTKVLIQSDPLVRDHTTQHFQNHHYNCFYQDLYIVFCREYNYCRTLFNQLIQKQTFIALTLNTLSSSKKQVITTCQTITQVHKGINCAHTG